MWCKAVLNHSILLRITYFSNASCPDYHLSGLAFSTQRPDLPTGSQITMQAYISPILHPNAVGKDSTKIRN